MPYTDPAKRAEVKRRYREANRDKIRAAGRAYALDRRGGVTVKPRHGMSGHPLYNTWKCMMARCYNPNDPRYHRYGARGIAVCNEWHDVAAFLTWIETNLGPRPKGMTMDRLNNDRNYGPGNVRWASAKVQQRHREHDAQGRFT